MSSGDELRSIRLEPGSPTVDSSIRGLWRDMTVGLARLDADFISRSVERGQPLPLTRTHPSLLLQESGSYLVFSRRRSGHQGLGRGPRRYVRRREADAHYPRRQGLWCVTLHLYHTLGLRLRAAASGGSRGFGDIIPENSALVFTTELMGLTKARDEL